MSRSKRFNRAAESIVKEYFIGPRDISKHSKWPLPLRMHGSIMPKLIVPVFVVACWSTLVTAISERVYPLEVHPSVLTVVGLVVGLALTFRNATAHERYIEGRKSWANLASVSQNLARVIWVHTEERERDLGKEDLLGKITCLNMIVAFAVALKHKLRFEPFIQYEDLHDLVGHLDTWAKEAGELVKREQKRRTWKTLGHLLNIPMFRSNPRKHIKRAQKPVGHLPLEILSYISCYVHEVSSKGTFNLGMAQVQALENLASLNEILAQTDRVLNTPLPAAYQIAISQITWIYLITLPLQISKAST